MSKYSRCAPILPGKRKEDAMIKIKISYQTEDELRFVLDRFKGCRVKIPEKQKGEYKRAYLMAGRVCKD